MLAVAGILAQVGTGITSAADFWSEQQQQQQRVMAFSLQVVNKPMQHVSRAQSLCTTLHSLSAGGVPAALAAWLYK